MFYISVAVDYTIPETWLPLYVINMKIFIFSVRGLNFNRKVFKTEKSRRLRVW